MSVLTKYLFFLRNGPMENIFLILVSSLATLTIVCTVACYWLTMQCIKLRDDARQTAKDLATAHNANAETVENVIAKINDLQTQLAMQRRMK